jgi:predicted Rossmann-fold nucleotide-binding protein
MLAEGKIGEKDLDIFTVCDEPREVVPQIKKVLDRAKPQAPRSGRHVPADKGDAQ